MMNYYPDDYGPHLEIAGTDHLESHSPTHRRGSREWGTKWLKSILGNLLDSSSTSLPELESPGKLLEVGCATGKFLSAMRDRGWETWGLEFAQKPADYARSVLGLNVIQGVAEEMEYPEESFDLVVAWMVLEHLHDPLGVLRRIRRTLRRGGYLAFSIPNAGAWEFKCFRKYWYALQVPSHLYHFTTSSLGSMMKKADLRIERIIFQRCMRNVVASIGLFLRDQIGATKFTNTLIRYPEQATWYAQLSLMPLSKIVALFRQSGRITVWARKV
jgi:2-polyprenyl-3-methyl-5-hydroxy-6-metoxy-1,4-benzoquinol methylase